MSAGYAAISYPDEDIGFGLGFDSGVLDSVWVFGTCGGWRGLNTVILEPCTGYLANLPDAIANGSALTLAAGATVATTRRARVEQVELADMRALPSWRSTAALSPDRVPSSPGQSRRRAAFALARPIGPT